MSIFNHAPDFFSPGEGKHIGFLYTSRREQLDVALKFMAAGISSGEMCIYSASENAPGKMRELFSSSGSEALDALESGQLSVISENESYLNGGRFDIESIFEFWAEVSERAACGGYSGLRVSGEMGWALRDPENLPLLCKYEAMVNDAVAAAPGRVTVLCQYDYRLFPEEFIKDMIFAHPFVI